MCAAENDYLEGIMAELTLAKKIGSLVEFTKAANADGFRRQVLNVKGVSF